MNWIFPPRLNGMEFSAFHQGREKTKNKSLRSWPSRQNILMNYYDETSFYFHYIVFRDGMF